MRSHENIFVSPMLRRRVLSSSLGSIFSHLSLEATLVSSTAVPTLFVWRNPATIVIGRHQNPWKECRVERLQEAGVQLCRRYSGGGAVYQDMGCTQFTLVFPHVSENFQSIIDSNYDLLVGALQSLGLPAVRTGRNDVSINGSKISGSAFKMNERTLLHHGTILVNTDLQALGSLLTPDARKLQSKGVDSVRKRVSNLSDFSASVSHETVADALFRAFVPDLPTQQVEELTQSHEFTQSQIFRSTHDHLQSWDWRFGRTPPFTHSFSTRVEGVGNFEVGLVVQDGVISDVLVHSDALDVQLVEALERRLHGLRYSPEAVRQSLDGHPLCDWVVANVSAQ